MRRLLVTLCLFFPVGCSLFSPPQRASDSSPSSKPVTQSGVGNDAPSAEAKAVGTQTGVANSIIDYAVAGVGGTTLLLIILAIMIVNYKSKKLDLEADRLRETTFIWSVYFASMHSARPEHCEALIRLGTSALGPLPAVRAK